MRNFLRWGTGRLFGNVLDLVYPSSCEVCGEVQERGRALCSACDEKLPRLLPPFCERCGEHFDGQLDGAFTCPNCHSLSFSFEFSKSVMILDDRTRRIIHRLKYGRGIHLAGELGRMAAEGLADPRFRDAVDEKWPLVPVPLHPSRQAWRHFNQAEEIALSMSQITGMPLLRALKRVRTTESQTHLSRRQRLENLKGAFAPTKASAAWQEKKGAVLVDDVFTTGSTVESCAKVLRKTGFDRVFVLTVMRG